LRALGWLAFVQNDFPAARARHEESVRLWRTLGNPEELALALLQLAGCTVDGTDPRAIAAAEEAVALAGEAGSAYAAAFSNNVLGLLAMRRSDWPAARAAFGEAAEISREAGARAPHASFVMNAAELDFRSGDFDGAAARFTEALSLFDGLGSQAPVWLVARVHMLLGDMASRSRKMDEAAAHYGEALQLSHKVGSVGAEVRSIAGLGRVAFRERAWRRAARLLGAAEALETAHQLADASRMTGSPLAAEAIVAEIRMALGEAAFAAAWAEGRALSLDEAVALALEEAAPA
jgi:tetratricopeptide (TPR) repeat protein